MKAVVSEAVLILASLGAPSSAFSDESVEERIVSEAMDEKRITSYEVKVYEEERLKEIAEEGEQGSVISLDTPTGNYEIDVRINPIFSDDVLKDYPDMYPLAGDIVGEEGTSARITVDLDRGTLNAKISDPNGKVLSAEPVTDQGGPLHVWYSNDDAKVVMPENDTQEPDGVFPENETEPGPAPYSEPTSTAPEAEGNQTFSPLVKSGLNTYENPRLRVFYDTGINPMDTVNRMDDLTSEEASVKSEILSIQAVNTDSWNDVDCGGDRLSTSLIERFENEEPLYGSEPNKNDRALLFTDNSNIDYNGTLGCAENPGTHGWVRWTGSDKQKALVAEHEYGHNFDADHSYNTSRCHSHWYGCHTHYTVMHDGYVGDSAMDETYSSTSQSVIENHADTHMPRKTQIWEGSDASIDGVKLLWWQIRYPEGPSPGNVIEAYREWTADSGQIDLDRWFVGARDGDGANRDFGHRGPGTIGDCCIHSSEWTYTLPSGETGTWSFWPAYKKDGSYGPYKWHEIDPGVS